ncbi:excisionase family DNA-binding protein [Mycolicibacillus trivialis]|uniref:excisionase family DNA-binding protein n=1 Tax=Mycobacteroides abscessus TaxID=36809 RepID=UPI000925D47C|nr:excisionase family DNA-binding protein [Mycobacteroides abscessus]SIH16362.1 DNA binding domain, excisionase family [Mycobacteroides abscessus subsp. abscessus]SLG53533.1 DNA binding domain, excisionase family [Mycobacteroides abscessus subsp. massiliense]SLH95533.1 DNA binding domain, excisionase family [Mycobacteroides abscessus subsp. massiliense]
MTTTTADLEAMFGITTLAERWDVHPDSIRALIKSGELKAHRVGKLYRISASDAQSYLDGTVA